MDLDSEAGQVASQFLRTSFITVVFTTCHYYETATTTSVLAHDQVYEDAFDSAELHLLIKKLKAKDEYNFEVLSKYPELKN